MPKARRTRSRQSTYQLRMIQLGLCARCGSEPLHSKIYGARCLATMRAAATKDRRAAGARKWKPGARGRPPIT